MLGSLMSQVLRTSVEILSRLKPANLFGNAYAFHISPHTYRCKKTVHRCNKTQVSHHTASAFSQAKPLSWLTLRVNTLLVLSNSQHLRQLHAARGTTSSVRGFTFGEGQTTASSLSSLLPGYHTGSSQTGHDCQPCTIVFPSRFTPYCLTIQVGGA